MAGTQQTLYYGDADGNLRQRVTNEENPTTPAGWTPLDAEAYAAKLSQIQAAAAQRQADIEAAEIAQKKSAYDALIAANLDPAVATTLTGYIPPTETVEGS
ncbi:hypothetical protein ABTX60_07380 [Streptomyces sp. NPDC126510]|uniref:hypothetical protein n=1 Tax=Streptomyces sp. NPDC126510 TaxID=3155317 RepID=UPI003322885D